MPANLVRYLELLEIIRAMYNKYDTKSFIVNTLMSPVYGFCRRDANRLYFDALNFFYSDNEIKQSAWQNIYAEHLENLAYYAIEKDDLDVARRCFIDAANMRGVGKEQKNEIPPEMLARPVVIYSIDAAKVGIPKASRPELAQFIDNLPEISERERVRVKRDAGVFETTLFEDLITNDEETGDVKD